MSFIYPMSAGYHKRMDLLIRWANKRFSTINFIILHEDGFSNEIIEMHLKYCNNLFIVDYKQHPLPKLFSVQKLSYKLITGRYPKFDSPLFLNKTFGKNFGNIVNTYKTDYFLNTQNSFGGLIKYVPNSTITLFDTQDIFTDMYKKYSIHGKNNLMKKILLGFKENGYFVKSEIDILSKYDKIIAITESDFQKYFSIVSLRNKLIKVESVGIEHKEYPVSTIKNKEFDCLIVASNFMATQEGVNWFFNQVAPYLSKPISVCIVGSICDYIESERLNNCNVEIKLQGIVNNIDFYYAKSKLVTLLILDATGTSVKGLEALAYGAAIVTTSAGVRFGGLEHDIHCMIKDNPQEFAHTIETLIKDKERRFKLGERALVFAKDKMSLNSAFEMLDRCY
jgi:glycosyltransferase involved in cell wall biosynthesis